MGGLTRLVVRFPAATVALGLALGCAALVLSGTRLGFHTSRLDLLNPQSDYNRLWIEYIKEFGDDDDAVVVVEGPSREQVVPSCKRSRGRWRKDRLFHAVLHEVDLGKIRARACTICRRKSCLALDGFLAEVSPIVGGDWCGSTWVI
jgi:hypothetical protein